jgi:hypothetical protein
LVDPLIPVALVSIPYSVLWQFNAEPPFAVTGRAVFYTRNPNRNPRHCATETSLTVKFSVWEKRFWFAGFFLLHFTFGFSVYVVELLDILLVCSFSYLFLLMNKNSMW